MPYITIGKENSGNIDLYDEDDGLGYAGVPSLVAKANGIGLDGVAEMNNSADIKTFIGLASQGKAWTRKI